MGFTVSQILLLENMTYLSGIAPLPDIMDLKGQVLGDVLNAISLDALDPKVDYASFMNGADWKNIIMAVRKDPELMECTIAETHLDTAYGGGGGKSVVFLNDSLKEAVVAFRGTAREEWLDDLTGGNTVDSLQQINALEWYKKVYKTLGLAEYFVTVTGHSKGGNKAKYITILNETVGRCVSFDGQGFSDKFMMNYAARILNRQDVIENHNIDFDYVNILLNDVGGKTYYVGFDYGRGGFAEAHCPNTFFNFGEDGEFTMEINPDGQRPEMQILDQFINSMVRSHDSEKEKSETLELVYLLMEKAFAMSNGTSINEFIQYVCQIIGSEKYADNAAYEIAFCIKYVKEVPEFVTSVRKILEYFEMTDLIKVLDMLQDILYSKSVKASIDLSNFLFTHVSKVLVKSVQSMARIKYGLTLTTEEVTNVLNAISMTRETMEKLHIQMDGSDIVLENADNDPHIPEHLNIVVLAGGLSIERNKSLLSGKMIAEKLTNLGHRVILTDAYMGYGEEELHIEDAFENVDKYSLQISEISDEVPDLWAVKKRRRNQSQAFFGPNVLSFCQQADLVFLALRGVNGESGKIQATFDILGIDYTGCDFFGSAVSSHKSHYRQLMMNNNIPVPKGISVTEKDMETDPADHGLSYPLIVRNCTKGIGLGTYAASNNAAYRKAVKEALKWDYEVIVEEYVTGREFSVCTLGGQALPVTEKLLSGERDRGDKETHSLVCPANIPKSLEKQLKEAAERAARCLGLHALSKTNFIVRPDGSFVCLESESLPVLTPDSEVMAAAAALSFTGEELCERILAMSLLAKRMKR
ncbi:MAG: DUF2974 domain-containing protein [Acetatifactor sp.]|nr:DUF2974 domain-containing protein [Acetatifactor sp.]